MPPEAERAERLRVVRQVLYLMFNEGYTTSGGPALQRADLTAEAIRLTRMLRALLPDDDETGGLLALMLLTDARRAARADAQGALIPLDEQDRSLWNAGQIAEGVALVSATLGKGPIGPYQLQAAIAALHDEAADRGGHRLAADPRAVRGAGTDLARPGGHARTRRSRSAGPGGRWPGWPCSASWTATSGWPATTGSRRSARTCWSGPATARAGARGVPAGGPDDDQRAGAALPDPAGRPLPSSEH